MDKKTLTARDVMGTDIVTVRDDASVWDVAKLFSERGIHGAPVVDDKGQLVGVVSQTDIVRHLQVIAHSTDKSQNFYFDMDNGMQTLTGKPVTARELMNPHVISAPEDAPVHELCRTLLRHHIHRIIITRDREIRGIVTTSDILKAI